MKRALEHIPPDRCQRCGGLHTGRECPFTSGEPDKLNAEQHTQSRPTIEQIERMLNADDDVELEILPNGEIRTADGKPTTRKPLTMRENLGGEYAA